MRQLIENLRSRPESHRHAVALGISLAITLIIGGIWATTIFPNAVSSQATIAEKNKSLEPQGPVKTFSRNMAQSFSALKSQLHSFGASLRETKYEAEPTLEVIPNENDSMVSY